MLMSICWGFEFLFEPNVALLCWEWELCVDCAAPKCVESELPVDWAVPKWWESELFEVGCDICWPDCKWSTLLGLKRFLVSSQAVPSKLLGILGSSRTPCIMSLWIAWSVAMGLVGVPKDGGAWMLPVLLWGPPLWGRVSFEWTPHLVCLPDQSACGGMEFILLVKFWVSGMRLFLPSSQTCPCSFTWKFFLIIFRAGNIKMTHLGIYYNVLNRWS